MDIKNILIQISKLHENDESCGFIYKKDENFCFLEVENRSQEKDKYFIIPSIDFLRIKSENNLIAIFHNHFSTPEKESAFDRSVSENICYPMVIYSNLTKKFNFYVPEYLECDVKDVERLKEILND